MIADGNIRQRYKRPIALKLETMGTQIKCLRLRAADWTVPERIGELNFNLVVRLLIHVISAYGLKKVMDRVMIRVRGSVSKVWRNSRLPASQVMNDRPTQSDVPDVDPKLGAEDKPIELAVSGRPRERGQRIWPTAMSSKRFWRIGDALTHFST